MNKDWIKNEFRDIAIRDKRLVKRLINTVESLFRNSEASILQAINKPKDIKAAYRLIDNNRVQTEAIMDAHREKTIHQGKLF